MPKGTLFVRSLNRIRPWVTGEKFFGISIVDTAGGLRDRPRGVKQARKSSEPDPESTSWPVAVASSNVPPRYPSGILSRANPTTGELGSYSPDDEEILRRFFGITPQQVISAPRFFMNRTGRYERELLED